MSDNVYEIYYEGELSADGLNETGVRKYFNDVRIEFDTEKATGYIDEDTTFDQWIEYYQVCLLVDTEKFL